MIGKGTGLEQGFDVYDQPSGASAPGSPSWERPAAAVASRAATWLRGRDPDRPFLLWAHFFDPHLPYLAPREFQAPGRPGYLAEVAAMDAGIGTILDALRAEGVLDETLIVVVADHGEGLEEHGERTHGTLVYDSTMHVPFLVRHPDGWRSGERSDEIVGVVDVAPTVCEALGLGALPECDGLSLFRRRVPGGRGVYFESYYGHVSFGWAPLAGWADARGKYVHGAEPELYAPGDREERENLAPERAAELARYREAIAALATRPPLEPSGGDAGGAGAGVAHLDALGYAGGHAAVRSTELPEPLADTGLPSPVAMKDVHNRFLDAKALQKLGRLDQAIPAFEELLREDPGNNAAWFQLGLARRDRGEWAAARDALGRAIATGGDGHPARSNLGFVHEMLGDPARALEEYRRAVEHAPYDFDLLQQVVRLLRDTGAPPDELARYNAMLVEAAERSRGNSPASVHQELDVVQPDAAEGRAEARAELEAGGDDAGEVDAAPVVAEGVDRDANRLELVVPADPLAAAGLLVGLLDPAAEGADVDGRDDEVRVDQRHREGQVAEVTDGQGIVSRRLAGAEREEVPEVERHGDRREPAVVDVGSVPLEHDPRAVVGAVAVQGHAVHRVAEVVREGRVRVVEVALGQGGDVEEHREARARHRRGGVRLEVVEDDLPGRRAVAVHQVDDHAGVGGRRADRVEGLPLPRQEVLGRDVAVDVALDQRQQVAAHEPVRVRRPHEALPAAAHGDAPVWKSESRTPKSEMDWR